MASGGTVGGTSIYKGSQEGFDYECDPCKVDDAITEAKHYCPVCQEYLCDECRAHHRRSRATKSHNILSGEEMPKKPDTARVMGSQNTCDCGQNVADYYCGDHKEVFCVTCKIVRHRSCNVKDLDDVVKNKRHLAQLNTTIDELKQLSNLATETESLQDTLLESLAVNENTCEDTIRAFRGKIYELLDNLERKAFDDLKGRCTVRQIELNDRKTVCSNIKDKLDADLKTSTDVLSGNDPREIFIQNLRLSQTLPLYRDAVNDAKSETAFKEILCVKEPYLEDMHTHVKQLMTFRDTQLMTRHDSFLGVNLKRLNKYSLALLCKGKTLSFDGVFLKNGDLIISNSYSSSALILLNATFQIKDTLAFKNPFWGITEISESEVICLCGTRLLYYIEVYPVMKLKKSVTLNKDCADIRHFEGRIFAYCYDRNSTEVRILSKEGTVLEVLCLSIFKDEIDDTKQFLCVSMDGTRLYISEFLSRTLTCMKTNGDMIFTYSGRDVKKPRGIVVDDQGNFIVCDQASGLKVFKSDGSFYRLLINVNNPLWLAWRKTDNIIVVCDGSKLTTYQMKFD